MAVVLERIETLCQINGTTVYALEKQMGVKHGTIRKWSTSTPYASNIQMVANLLNTSVDYLLGLTDNPLAVNSIINSTKALQEILVLFKKQLNVIEELEQIVEKHGIKALETIEIPVASEQSEDGKANNDPETEEVPNEKDCPTKVEQS